jgi:hypothetical protein
METPLDNLPPTMSKAELARHCGVSRTAVSNEWKRAVNKGEQDPDARKVDTSAPWVQEYLARSTKTRGQKQPRKDKTYSGEPSQGVPPTNSTFTGVSILELDRLKKVEDIRKLQLDNGKKERSLVDRGLVERMFGVIDRALNMIIMDGRASMVPQLYKKIKGGCSLVEAQQFYHEECGKYIAPVKPELVRAMKKYDKEN